MGDPITSQEGSKDTHEEKIGYEESSSFTCEICTEALPSTRKFEIQNNCDHPFCMNCVGRYIKTQVLSSASSQIKCPEPECSTLLDPVSCKTLISKHLFHRWCDNLCMQAFASLDTCYCPNRNCSMLIVNECGKIKKGPSKCPSCNELFCFRCKVSWHKGYGCKQRRRWNERMFKDLALRKRWIRCPGCGYCIERNGGCKFITCRCKTFVCYDCGSKCDEDHECKSCMPKLVKKQSIPFWKTPFTFFCMFRNKVRNKGEIMLY